MIRLINQIPLFYFLIGSRSISYWIDACGIRRYDYYFVSLLYSNLIKDLFQMWKLFQITSVRTDVYSLTIIPSKIRLNNYINIPFLFLGEQQFSRFYVP